MLLPLECADLFSPQECFKIIGATHPAAFAPAGLAAGIQHQATRRARIAWLDDAAEGAWIFRRILDAVTDSNRRHFNFALDEFSERMQVAHYAAETNDFFDWHSDIGAGHLAQRRKLTIVVQLSDGDSYQGGDLETNADGNVRQASRACGSALLMPSFVLHRVVPVTRRSRYSLTLWAHGPRFC